MDAALIASAAVLGLGGAPHCAAMCAAPCTALTARGGAPTQLAFHAARLLSYALAGAIVASSTGALAQLAQWSPALRPLWVLLQLAVLGLGLWLLWQGRQPAWLGSIGRRPVAADAIAPVGRPVSPGCATKAVVLPSPSAASRPAATPVTLARAAAAGGLWAAWPCGLLHSALLVAAMTQGATSGAAAMAGFALTSAAGLVWGPWLWRRIGARAAPWAARLAGAMLVAAAGWALGHGLWQQVAAYCGF